MLGYWLKNNFNKKCLMETEVTSRRKRILVSNYFPRPNKNILMLLMSKVFTTTKTFWKLQRHFPE